MNLTQTMVTAAPLFTLLAVASLSDLRERRIPNGLSLGGAVVGLFVQTTLLGPTGLSLGAAGWVLCLVCFLPFYLGGGMAAGDVKLMAMVGSFLGPLDGFVALLCTMAAGAVIGLLYAAWVLRTESTSGGDHRSRTAAALRSTSDLQIPYAIAIGIGTAISFMHPQLVIAAWSQGGWA